MHATCEGVLGASWEKVPNPCHIVRENHGILPPPQCGMKMVPLYSLHGPQFNFATEHGPQLNFATETAARFSLPHTFEADKLYFSSCNESK